MIDRRGFLKLAAMGSGAVFASALHGPAQAGAKSRAEGYEEFFFVQLSDSHWGYSGPANPQADTTLKTAAASVNALEVQPDFIVFTGDLTHTTDGSAERRRRMVEFRSIVAELKVKDVRFTPGEHDASLGEVQLQWLRDDLSGVKKSAPIVVFTHRPLFDRAPAWDWAAPLR